MQLGGKSEPDNLHLILPGNPEKRENELWLGNLKAANNTRTLKARNIKTVLTIINNIDIKYAKADNIVHHVTTPPHMF